MLAVSRRPRRDYGLSFSGHSGRVGIARRVAKAGAATHEIIAQGRWKTAKMVEVFTRGEDERWTVGLFRRSAARTGRG